MPPVSEADKILKTSEEWYALDTSRDIKRGNGWENLKDPAGYWFNTKITKKEYAERLTHSTMVGFKVMDHRSPFLRSLIGQPAYLGIR